MTTEAAAAPGVVPQGTLREVGDIGRLAAGFAAAALAHHSLGLIDTAMLGHYSSSALAGAGLAISIQMVVVSFGLGVMCTMDAHLPRTVGAGDLLSATRYLRAGEVVAFAFGLLAVALIIPILLILPSLGVADDVAREARSYGLWRSLGFVPDLAVFASQAYLRTTRRVWPLVGWVVFTNLIDIVLNYVLIFGLDLHVAGFHIVTPDLGSAGGALSTVFSSAVLLIALRRSAWRDLPGTPRLRELGTEIRTVLRVGLPVIGEILLVTGFFSILGVLAGRLGEVSMAAHQCLIMLYFVAVIIGDAFSSSVAVVIGTAWGARGGEPRTGRPTLIGAVLMSGVLVAGATLGFLLRDQVLGLFSSDPRVHGAIKSVADVGFVAALMLAPYMMLSAARRATADTRMILVAAIVGSLAGSISALSFAAHADLELRHCWLAILIFYVAGSLVLLVRSLPRFRTA